MAEREIAGKDMFAYRRAKLKFVISSVTVESAGTGYSSAPSITFTGGGGTGATATAVMSGTGSTQTVSSILVTSPGSNYATAPSVVFTGGTPTSAASASVVLSAQFDLIVCLTQHDLDQTSNTITADTFCGKKSVDGTKDAKFSFSNAITLNANSGHVPIKTLQDDYISGNYTDWKITTVAQLSGDMLWEFSAFVESAKFSAGTSGLYSGSFSLQLDDNGATLTILP